MTLFLIVAEDDSDPADLRPLIDGAFPDAAYRINKRCWILSVDGMTTSKIAKALKIAVDDDEDENEGTQGVAVFRTTPSYWGNANPKMWDWLSSKLDKKSNG